MQKLRANARNIFFMLKAIRRYAGLRPIVLYVFYILTAYVSTYVTIRLPETAINAIISITSDAETFEYLARKVAALIFIALLAELLSMVANSYMEILVTRLNYQVQLDVMKRSAAADLRNFDDPKFFNAFSYAADQYATNIIQMVQWFRSVLSSFSRLSAAVIAVSQMSPLLLVIIVASLTIMLVLNSKSAKLSVKTQVDITQHRRFSYYLRRIFNDKSVMQETRSTNAGDMLFERTQVENSLLLRKHGYMLKLDNIFGALNSVKSRAAELAMILLISRDIVRSSYLRAGDYAGLLVAAQAFSSNIEGILSLFPFFVSFSASAEQYRLFFEAESVIELSSGEETPPDTLFETELKNVSFEYPNSSFSIRNVSLKITPGEKIAIVGRNGAGKSTLMKLLLRLYDTDSGDILYNGRSIREYDVHALRRRVGIAFQQPSIYALTLRDNLQVYHRATDDELRSVLIQVGLSRLTDSLDSEITKEFDENGIVLSGGEAQKLAIARLLLGDFGLLLLDEPSSALDPIAEREVVDMLFSASNRATTIMVAHRLSTVRNADRIYVIEDGAVAEQGTHDELMAMNGIYAEMFTLQAENYVG
jgi:ATP-binding cassette subfamily B protein